VVKLRKIKCGSGLPSRSLLTTQTVPPLRFGRDDKVRVGGFTGRLLPVKTQH
jgi:hypothetical protein